MKSLHLLSSIMLVGPACTFHTTHRVDVVRTITARELAAASVPLAPGETEGAGQTELVTKDGQTFRVEQGRFRRTESEIIARSDLPSLQSFPALRRVPIDDVRRVVLVDVVERRSEPVSDTSVSMSSGATALLVIVGVAGAAFGAFVWGLTNSRM